jgi:hypothetical protein
MADRSVVQSQGEAELIDADAEKSQIKKRPGIAPRESPLGRGIVLGKCGQPKPPNA